MTKGRSITVLEIKFTERDGIVYASSDDLLGLHVCGKTRRSVTADLPAMIKTLYRLNHGIQVDVEAPFDSEFKKQTSKPAAISNWIRLLAAPVREMQVA